MPTLKEAFLGTEEQNRKGQEMLDKQAAEGSKIAKMLGGKTVESESFKPQIKIGSYAADKAYKAEMDAGRKGKADIDPYGAAKAAAQNADDEVSREHSRGMKKGGKVGSASKRADGCCIRGKTRA